EAGTTATFSGAQLTDSIIAVNESADTGATALVINVAADQTNGFAGLTFASVGVGNGFDDGVDTITINGPGGNETITRTGFADTINAGAGTDTLAGGGGNDVFVYAVGTDGNDTIDGGNNGTPGDDSDTLIVQGTAATEVYNINRIEVSPGVFALGINIYSSEQLATPSNSEIITTDVEEIVINTNGGGDTIKIVGDLGGTGVAQNTITVA